MMRLTPLALCLLAPLWLACPAPTPKTGAILCSAGRDCPRGYGCAPDNRCYLAGTFSSPDLNTTGGGDMTSREGLCTELCACLKTTCNGIAATPGADDDTDACEESCRLNTSQNLPCRWLHCTDFAVRNPPASAISHCPHARGQDPATCM